MDKKWLFLASTIALVAGFLSSGLVRLPFGDIEPVYASLCQVAHPGPCALNYRTAAIDVDHYAEAYTLPVEPNTGESWSIASYWNTSPPPTCWEISQTATVDVYWTGSQWALANKSLTADILDIQICSGEACGSYPDSHAWSYRLIVKVRDPVPTLTNTYNVRQVVFATTSVDDGYVIDENCDLTDAVSPTSQTFSATDSGTGEFECGFSCSNIGTSVTITYE